MKVKVIPIERCCGGDYRGEVKTCRADQWHREVPVQQPMAAFEISNVTVRDCLSL